MNAPYRSLRGLVHLEAVNNLQTPRWGVLGAQGERYFFPRRVLWGTEIPVNTSAGRNIRYKLALFSLFIL